MRHSHRAGNLTPSNGMYVNPEHTDNPPERSERMTPEEYTEHGVNFPYRGTETHGVAYPDPIPDELEGSPDKYDLTLPPHLAEKPEREKAIPVTVVNNHEVCRIPWMADQFNLDANAPGLMVVGRQDNREYVVIRNHDAANNLYIGPNPNVNPSTGFLIPPNSASHRIKTTEALYACSDHAIQCSVMWEFRQEVH